jgi:hypothetical protein
MDQRHALQRFAVIPNNCGDLADHRNNLARNYWLGADAVPGKYG